MAKYPFFSLLLLLAVACTTPSEPPVYLFSFFQGNGEDGLHLAYSEDGLSWTALRNNASFLTPTAGEDQLMRDPCVIQGKDGRFHMVWTVSWNEQGIGYAHSTDLIQWSEQRYLPVMEHEPETRNCWAPELYYESETGEYMIYWASTIPGRFPETDSSGDNGYNHRMYYVTTTDFQEFSETKLLYEHGFNVIDATIQKIGGEYLMFLKNETKYPKAEKNIRVATSQHLTGPYSAPSESISADWVEGPTAIETERGWIVYFDQYTLHEMGAVLSTDGKDWTDISEEISFPEGTRHGSVFPVKKSVLAKLLKE